MKSMDSKEFWRLIEVALEQSGGDEERQATLLVAALVALGASAIIGFGTFCKRYVRLVIERADYGSSHFTCIMRGEHDLMDFAHSLVGQGESEFYRGLAANDARDPDRVSSLGYRDTPLGHVVPTAYYECTGHDHPDWVGYSEHLAACSDTAEAGSGVFDNLDISYWEGSLHDSRKEVLLRCRRLSADAEVFCLHHTIAGLYHRLPTWKQNTRAGTLLAKAAILTQQFASLVDSEDGYDIHHALEMLVPHEPLHAPEGSNAA